MTASAISRMRLLLPEGCSLPDSAWRARHHAMVGVLFAEAIGLVLFSWAQGNSWLHNIAHAAALIPIGVIALLIEDRRRAASVLVSLGLITACAARAHLARRDRGPLPLLRHDRGARAYEDWVPFLVAAAYVVLHHGAMRVRSTPTASTTTRTPSTIPGSAHSRRLRRRRRRREPRGRRTNEGARAAANESRRAQGRLRAPIGMILFSFSSDHTGGVSQVNEAMCQITGHAREHLEMDSMRDVRSPR